MVPFNKSTKNHSLIFLSDDTEKNIKKLKHIRNSLILIKKE